MCYGTYSTQQVRGVVRLLGSYAQGGPSGSMTCMAGRGLRRVELESLRKSHRCAVASSVVKRDSHVVRL